MRKADHGDSSFGALERAFETYTVFGVESDIARHRKHAQARHGRSSFKKLHAVLEQRPVPTKAVYREALDQSALVRRQQVERSANGGKHAAAVDVGNQQAARIGVLRHREIHQIAAPQIHLRDAPRTFDDDVIETAAQTVSGAAHENGLGSHEFLTKLWTNVDPERSRPAIARQAPVDARSTARTTTARRRAD